MKCIRAAVLTISDSAAQGRREDRSGPALYEQLSAAGMEIIARGVVPDEVEAIAERLIEYADERGAELIVTTGGTGVSARDVTPEATRAVADREVPGYGEIMRAKSFELTPHALLSRAGAYIRRQTLILNLPGSPKAAQECLEFVLAAIPHTIQILRGQTEHG